MVCWGPRLLSPGPAVVRRKQEEAGGSRRKQEEAGADLSEEVHSQPVLLEPLHKVGVAGHGGGLLVLLVRVGADPGSCDLGTRWRIGSGDQDSR